MLVEKGLLVEGLAVNELFLVIRLDLGRRFEFELVNRTLSSEQYQAIQHFVVGRSLRR